MVAELVDRQFDTFASLSDFTIWSRTQIVSRHHSQRRCGIFLRQNHSIIRCKHFSETKSCTFLSFKLFEKLHNHAIIYMKNDQSPQNVFYYISYIILAKAPRSQRISQVFVTQTETNGVILWTISSLKNF